MGESKTPKLTAPLDLTLWERLTIHGILNAVFKPVDRDDERAMNRVWNALELDAATQDMDARNAAAAAAGAQVKIVDVNTDTVPFDCDEAHLKWLDSRLPIAVNGAQARVLGPVRERVTTAREALK